MFSGLWNGPDLLVVDLYVGDPDVVDGVIVLVCLLSLEHVHNGTWDDSCTGWVWILLIHINRFGLDFLTGDSCTRLGLNFITGHSCTYRFSLDFLIADSWTCWVWILLPRIHAHV